MPITNWVYSVASRVSSTREMVSYFIAVDDIACICLCQQPAVN